MQPAMIKVASFNVGSMEEWVTLYSRAKWKEKDNRDFSSSADLKVQREALHAFEKREGITKEQACEAFTDKVNNHFGRLIREFDPHILCLQEFVNLEKFKQANAHSSIKTFLEAGGYAIVGEANRAIAYKQDSFDCLKSEVRFSESSSFADLKHRSGMVIRVVSDHLKGFDGVQQKSLSAKKAKKLPLPKEHEERTKLFQQNELTAHGDLALERSLDNLDKDNDPDLIVYGLDANCTSKQSSPEKSQRLHPKRMRLFEIYNYQMDHSNQAPTCLDIKDWQPRKYHYICTKSLDSKRTISITDHIMPGINHPSLLREPGAIMSSHLPVLSTLTITKLKSDGCQVS
ncbi:MAG: hypothetical protein LLG04_06650 [Parachlamydia sp.]|nr:hypothetical protein [Parachlamydia sp.]